MAKLKFDDILVEIGDFGKYQKKNYVLLIIGWMISSPFMLLSVFILGVPDHRCSIPGLPNDTYAIQNDAHQHLISLYIPKGDDENVYDECHVYNYGQNHTMLNSTLVKCTSWVYSKDVFQQTFLSKLDLVCEDKHKPAILKTIFFGGVLVGSIGFGSLSDLIGRKKTLSIAVFFLATFSMGLSWSPNYTVYAIIRFCIGVCNVGLFLTVYVIGMEWVGPSRRTWAGLLIATFSPVATLIMIVIAYFVRDWFYIEIAASIPAVIYFFVTWVVSESPRWLLSKGKVQDASKLLEKAAKVNNTTFSPKMLEDVETKKNQETGRIWLLFSSRILAFRTLVIFYNWMVVSMTFYGLALNTGSLYGNFYVTFLISVLVELPGHILPILTLNRFGRKKVHGFFMFVGGLACLSTIFSVNFGGKDLQPLTTALAMIGKCGATAAFATVYVFSAELFPTVVRNAGMGASSSCARVGGMIAPLIADAAGSISGSMRKTLPIVVFGAASVVAAILTLFLPETLNQNLPETIADGENFGRNTHETKSEEKVVEIATTELTKL